MPVPSDLSDGASSPDGAFEVQYADDLTQEEWDEICTRVDEEEARGEKPIFNSGDYASDEEAMAALEAWLDSILKEVMNGRDSAPARHDESSHGHH